MENLVEYKLEYLGYKIHWALVEDKHVVWAARDLRVPLNELTDDDIPCGGFPKRVDYWSNEQYVMKKIKEIADDKREQDKQKREDWMIMNVSTVLTEHAKLALHH